MDQPFKPWILQNLWEQFDQNDEPVDGSPKLPRIAAIHLPKMEAG
ncbi:hypothetical protein [Ochrobactrum soli]|nr:hypothetical protein [[Ochrobactrum] soli]